MKYKADIDIMPLKALLDPQGKAVSAGLKNLGLNNLSEVRIGKHITLEVEAEDEAAAGRSVEEACKKLLANAIMEDYRYSISVAAPSH